MKKEKRNKIEKRKERSEKMEGKHRTGFYGRSLCGEACKACEMTIDDNDVQCAECLGLLEKINTSSTRTREIEKIKKGNSKNENN